MAAFSPPFTLTSPSQPFLILLPFCPFFPALLTCLLLQTPLKCWCFSIFKKKKQGLYPMVTSSTPLNAINHLHDKWPLDCNPLQIHLLAYLLDSPGHPIGNSNTAYHKLNSFLFLFWVCLSCSQIAVNGDTGNLAPKPEPQKHVYTVFPLPSVSIYDQTPCVGFWACPLLHSLVSIFVFFLL